MADKKEAVDAWEKLGIRPTSIGLVPKILDVIWATKPRFTTCLVGETGIGKTPIVHQWCAARRGYMKTLNFGHMTQEEISMIMFAEDGGSFDFVPPKFLLDLNEKAEEHGCAVLFLDEWNRGDKALVNALFTLTDERRIHSFRLHENVVVVAAMNPSDGSYLVNEAEKDHAIRKRLNFVYTTHDLASWLQHTMKSEWHPLVPAFIKAMNTFLYDAGARDAGKCFPCPSNWEKVSRILDGAEKTKTPLDDLVVRTLVEGQIGCVAASKFMDFVADQNSLIQPIEILTEYRAEKGVANVREKVAKLLNCKIDRKTNKFVENDAKKNQAGVIIELCQGISMELFSTMPEVSKTSKHLALFVGDLPNEILSTFAAQHLADAARERGDEGMKYLGKISSAMQVYPEYKERMKLIVEAMSRHKRASGMLTGKDPK